VETIIPEGPPNVVGSRYTEVHKFMGQDMKSTMEITAFEQNDRWAVRVIKGPVPYEVTPIGEIARRGCQSAEKHAGRGVAGQRQPDSEVFAAPAS